MTKECAKCKQEKPEAEFGKKGGGRDGLRSHCKVCTKTSNATWYTANKERVRNNSKTWYRANTARKSDLSKAWVDANREHVRVSQASWRADNAAKLKAKSKAWYANNTDRHCASGAAWQLANAEHVRTKHATWYLVNSERVKANSAAWNAANPNSRRIRTQNRRARELAGGKLSKDIAERLFKLQDGKCACCGQPLVDYHLDHRMPLALGGTNTDDNVQLLLPKCNMRKGAKHPDVYMAQIAQELRCA